MMISYLLLVFTSWWRLIDYQDLRFSRAVLTIHSRSAPFNAYDSFHTPLCNKSSEPFGRACNVLSLLHTIPTLSLLWNLYLHSHEVSTTPSLSLSSQPHLDCLISLLSLFIFLQRLGDSCHRCRPGIPFSYGENIVKETSFISVTLF